MLRSVRLASLLSCLAFLAPAHAHLAGTPPAGAGTYRLINLMPAYWEFWEQAQQAEPAVHPALFRKLVADRHPAAYAGSVIGLPGKAPYEEELAQRYARVFPLVRDKIGLMRVVSTNIARDLQRYESKFRVAFPDLSYTGDVYFMNSLGGFDGALREIDGKTVLLFGIDMIAYVYGQDADPEPFFHHELFHIYHRQFPGSGSDGDKLIGPLWREGLATFVAQALNPQAGGVAIFGLPRSTPARVQAEVGKHARALHGLLDSTSRDDYKLYFTGGADENAAVPARAGYYVGYLVAKRLAERRSLAELARTPLAQLRPEIEQALAELGAR